MLSQPPFPYAAKSGKGGKGVGDEGWNFNLGKRER